MLGFFLVGVDSKVTYKCIDETDLKNAVLGQSIVKWMVRGILFRETVNCIKAKVVG